jgi:hypothetical protein
MRRRPYPDEKLSVLIRSFLWSVKEPPRYCFQDRQSRYRLRHNRFSPMQTETKFETPIAKHILIVEDDPARPSIALAICKNPFR